MRGRFFLFTALAIAAGMAVIGVGVMKSGPVVEAPTTQTAEAASPVPPPIKEEAHPQGWTGALLSAPAIRWTAKAEPNAHGRLHLAFKADASAPLRTLQVKITPASSTKGLSADGETRDIPTWLMGNKSIDWDGEVDLTGSLLAGQRVNVQVVATDEDHRTGTSEAADVTLPEHRFTQPLANALNNLRKGLREDPYTNRGEALKALAGLLQQRGPFEDQNLALLTLRSAAVRIALDDSPAGMKSALDLLWHAAMLFEENPSNVTVSLRLTPKPVQDQSPKEE
jgi:hypothetical protein